MKKKTWFIVFSVLLCSLSYLSALEKRTSPVSLTTSIIIPCKINHAIYLEALIEAYSQQTILPDEIVISISPIRGISTIIKNLERGRWPFSVRLILNEEGKSASENRNLGCSIATGDIFILQDADDLPHIRRVEIIKYFFEHYPIDHLLHGYSSSYHQLPVIDTISQVSWFVPEFYDVNHGTNGAAAFSRKVFDEIKYEPQIYNGEDVQFNSRVYEKFQNKLAIKTSLYFYKKT